MKRQTYPAIEHIVCDGGSTDATVDVLRRASPTVQWTSEPDAGQASAVNKALRRSSGDIVGWLNSDDAYFDPRAVERAVSVFARRPEVGVVYGHAALVGGDGEVLQLMWSPPFVDWLHRRTNFIVQPAAFVRRSTVGDALLDERYDFTMDRELWIRLASDGHRFARIPHIVAIDRHHATRKVYTMQETGDRERDRLGIEHGLPDWRAHPRLAAAFRVGTRLCGVRLVRAAYRDAAFDVRRPSRRRLLARQVAMRRRWLTDERRRTRIRARLQTLSRRRPDPSRPASPVRRAGSARSRRPCPRRS